MMRKHLSFLAFPLLLAGCADREATDFPTQDSDFPIRFSPARVETRGTTVTEIADGTSFGVSAYRANTEADMSEVRPEVFYNEEVTRKGGTYAHGHTAYWPISPAAKICFFAWYPYQSGQNGLTGQDDTGYPSFIYKINTPDDSSPVPIPEQTDLLYASTGPINNSQTKAPVAFTFRHALARIRFRIRLNLGEGTEGYTVSLKQITFGAINQGRMTFTAGEKVEWKTYLDDSGTGYSWGSYTLGEGEGLGQTHFTSKGDGSDEATDVTADGYDLYVIPQKVNTGDYAPSLKLAYKLQDTEGKYLENEITLSLGNTGTDWTPGATIVYTLAIGKYNFTVTPRIMDWDKGNEGNEDIEME